jgi:hypothetical protein
LNVGNDLVALPANGEVVEKCGVESSKGKGRSFGRCTSDVDFQAANTNEWRNPKPYPLDQSYGAMPRRHLSDFGDISIVLPGFLVKIQNINSRDPLIIPRYSYSCDP